MNGLTKYILFVFTKNDNPKEFAEQIAEDLSVLSDTPRLNYYYGPESSVFTISTLDSPQDVKEYVDMVLNIDTISYILLPYTTDTMSYNLPIDVSEHLFNDGVYDYMSGNTEKNDKKDIEVRNMLRDKIREEFDLTMEWFGVDDFPEGMNNKTKKTPTFDELFDKIAESGIESLTPEELVTLNKYSK